MGRHGWDAVGAGGVSGAGLAHSVRLHGEGRQEFRQGGLFHRSVSLRRPHHSLRQRSADKTFKDNTVVALHYV